MLPAAPAHSLEDSTGYHSHWTCQVWCGRCLRTLATSENRLLWLFLERVFVFFSQLFACPSKDIHVISVNNKWSDRQIVYPLQWWSDDESEQDRLALVVTGPGPCSLVLLQFLRARRSFFSWRHWGICLRRGAIGHKSVINGSRKINVDIQGFSTRAILVWQSKDLYLN